jgi:hypothetical protein
MGGRADRRTDGRTDGRTGSRPILLLHGELNLNGVHAACLAAELAYVLMKQQTALENVSN